MDVYFYEKPGCINNTKQKVMLKDLGHKVRSFNILELVWSVEALRPFFKGMPVKDWFNMSAPSIKNGDIKPSDLDAHDALKAMVKDHYLIKRPLLRVGDRYGSGFDCDLAKQLLNSTPDRSLLHCPRISETYSCNDLQ